MGTHVLSNGDNAEKDADESLSLYNPYYESNLENIIQIQSFWRMYQLRDRYKSRLLASVIFGVRTYSATVIQQYWRGYHTRKVLAEEWNCVVIRYPACGCPKALAAANKRLAIGRNIEDLFLKSDVIEPLDNSFSSCCYCCPLRQGLQDSNSHTNAPYTNGSAKAQRHHNGFTGSTQANGVLKLDSFESSCSQLCCCWNSISTNQNNSKDQRAREECCLYNGCLSMIDTDTKLQSMVVERLSNDFNRWSTANERRLAGGMHLLEEGGSVQTAQDESSSPLESPWKLDLMQSQFARCFANLIQPTKKAPLLLNNVRANVREECLYVITGETNKSEDIKEEPAITGLGTCIRRPVCYFCGVRLLSVTNSHEELSEDLKSGEEIRRRLSAPKWISTHLRVMGSFDSLPWKVAYPLWYCPLRQCLVFVLPKDKIKNQTSILHDLGRQGFDPDIRAAYDTALSCLLSRVWRRIVWDTYRTCSEQKGRCNGVNGGRKVSHIKHSIRKVLDAKRASLFLYTQQIYPQLVLGVQFKFMRQRNMDYQSVEWLINDYEHMVVKGANGILNNKIVMIT